MVAYQIFLAALAALLAVAAAAYARAAWPALAPADRQRALGLLAAAAAATAARAALSTPSFLHANLHACGLVEATLAFPEPSTVRATYGQLGFLAPGAIAALFGRRFEVIAAANQGFAGLSLAISAWMAGRYSGSRWAAWGALACGALYPPLARVAASEDVHTLAVLLGWIALWGMDGYARERRRAGLVVAVLALLLMINTWQTLYAWVPCAFLLGLGRAGRSFLADRAARLAFAAVMLGAALRVALTVSDASERTSLIVLAIMLMVPSAVLELLAQHPLLDALRFGPALPALLLAGVWGCYRRGGALRALAAAFLAFFALTLGFGFPTPGVEFGFRLPALALGVAVAGCGLSFLLERAARAWGEARARCLDLGHIPADVNAPPVIFLVGVQCQGSGSSWG